MESALRRTWRSLELVPVIIEAAEEKDTPCGPAPANAASCKASVAVASSVRYSGAVRSGFAFARAACSVGWDAEVGVVLILGTLFFLAGSSAPDFESDCSGLRDCFGEEPMVVGAVVAVRGRSPGVLLFVVAALLDDCGIFPVTSSALMRDLRSVSSSQTVEGAVCESTESEDSGEETLRSEFSTGDSSSDSRCLDAWLCRLL